MELEIDQFKEVMKEIVDMLYTCDPHNEECCVCKNTIEESENKATCESCNEHYHVTCMGFLCQDLVNEQRLIWICSYCGNNNIAHRLFDKVCIPSHINRYQPLETVDEVFNDDVLLLTKQNDKHKKCRSKKRYFKKCKKIIIEPGNQSVKVMKSSEFDTHEHDHLVTQRDSPKQRDQVHSEEVGSNEWMKVKSKKAKMLEKIQDRISHSTAKSDSGTGQKKRIINGVVLEPGVTYIGKAMKSFYERRKSKKSKRKVDIKLNRDVECQNVLENNVQMYAEKLLNEYSKCVQSPKSMMSHETKLYKKIT
ncbi:uncharacterized protein LOC115924141 [Strongylocentrotus purpuratus]|uniref:PHD-type domain-containing protein n=1 Tax=Strongylocentrotus purpuratus TaxID=7668 RepID=A0A7M7P014_STRPU|nr:uncharacterized protein LOC115924141 [Strongylocentrotus purpuratus]